MVISQLRQRKAIQIPATLITVGLMILLPLLIHLLPAGNVPLGAQLLPIFYAPFVAAALFYPAVSLVAALVTPFLNYAFTGSPLLNIAVILSWELVVFSAVAHLLYRRYPRFWLTAPLAYVAAKLFSLIALTILPINLVPVSPWQFVSNSLVTAWPGLVMLLVINVLLIMIVARQRGSQS